MLALEDPSENGRQRSAAEAERFTDAYSQLEAFRHPIDKRDVNGYVDPPSAVIFDRYAFFKRRHSRFVFDVYDLDTGAVRFVN